MKEDKKYSGASIAENNGEILKKLLPGTPINAVGTAFSLCKMSFCGFFDWHIDVKEQDWFGDEKKWKDPKFSFTTEDLIQCDIEITNQFDGFGLLKATHIHEVPTDTSAYNFSHLSIQEFLCSLYISLLPQKEQLHLMNKHFQDYPNVFIFLSGLTMLQCNELYQIIYNKMMPVDTFSSNPDVVPAVRSIYESKCTYLTKSAALFKLDMSGNHLVLFDCFCASHIISHYPVGQLNLKYCCIGDTRAEVLAEKDYSNDKTATHVLELLNLAGNNLTAFGMVHVMKVAMKSEFIFNICR